MATEKSMILAELEPLIADAERRGLWLFCAYQQMWFSPRELRTEHATGRFIWGPKNWTLRNPQELLAEALALAASAQKYVVDVQRRIAEESK